MTKVLGYAFGWGIGLWLVGYVLGIALFAVVPTSTIGWVISPVGVGITLLVLWSVKREPLSFYVLLSLTWTVLAVILDYVFIVRLFNPPDGYYKPDVYLYYSLTFALPLAVGWLRTPRNRSASAG